MESFGAWVREQRKARRMTQTECAIRAAMKLQQWNEMERKLIRRPHLRTVEAVARGLEMPLDEALTAADSELPEDLTRDTLRLACRLQRHLGALPEERRHRVEETLEQVAQSLSTALAAVV